jgi:hypothetical protein
MNRLILASLFFLSSIAFVKAEGTREVRPTVTSGGQISVWDWGGEFATYNAPAERRLHVNVKDHTKEQVY